MINLQDFCQTSNLDDQSVGGDHCSEFEVALDFWDKALEGPMLKDHTFNSKAFNLLEGLGNNDKRKLLREEIVSEPDMRHSDGEKEADQDCPIKDGCFHALVNLSIDDYSNLHNRYPIRSK